MSREAVNAFASDARARGFQVWLPPEVVRPDASARRDYADDGDCMGLFRIEHKVRHSVSWTCRDDFPYRTVIVDEVYKEDAKAHNPVLLYVIVDQTRTHAAVVYGWTRDKWEVERMYDPIQKRDCDFYTIDKRYVRFCPAGSVF
jgi:hypothetical protein